MKASKPFFSIIIPSYNRADLIGKTIESVLNQSYSGFELIVVDDGSTDDTEAVVKKFQGETVSYFKKKNEERGKARNFGASKAKGDFVYFLDSDDLLYENHLQLAFEFIAANSPDIFFQQYEFLDENQKTTANYAPKVSPINEDLVRLGNFMSCHGVFIKREVFLANQFVEDRELAGSEDYELWLRMAARYPIGFSREITSALVQHKDRSVLNFDAAPLIKRKEKMLSYLFADKPFMDKYAAYKGLIQANAYSYISLHLALIQKKKMALSYLVKSLKASYVFIFRKRFWAILRHLLLT